MKLDWLKICLGTIIVALLAWWLWNMGIEDTRKWVLACVGGFLMEVGMIGGIGISYPYPRSGMQVKMILNAFVTVCFIMCCIYSFFLFSVPGFVIPVGLVFLFFLLAAIQVYRTKM